MNPRPEVVRELRSLFKEGATPSRLIRPIVERHEGERGLHALIQAYFLEAFGMPIVRGLDPADDYRHDDLRYAFLNEQLIHDMVGLRSEWDAGSEKGGGQPQVGSTPSRPATTSSGWAERKRRLFRN